jgi:hypothetical protein
MFVPVPLILALLVILILCLVPALVLLVIGLAEQRHEDIPLSAQMQVAWCSRPAHLDGPCNGWPRPNCPGFDAFCREHPGYAEHCLDHTLSSTEQR